MAPHPPGKFGLALLDGVCKLVAAALSLVEWPVGTLAFDAAEPCQVAAAALEQVIGGTAIGCGVLVCCVLFWGMQERGERGEEAMSGADERVLVQDA